MSVPHPHAHPTPTPTPRVFAAAVALATAAAGLGLAGCRGDRTDAPPRQFFPDMDHQPKKDPQEASDLFEDGRAQRLPPEGAVAFARAQFSPATYGDEPWAATFMAERADLLAESDAIYRGVTGPQGGEVTDPAQAEWVDYIPIPVTEELIEHGAERFNVYCAVCHGYTGDGRGSVGVRWSYAPANLTGAPYTDRSQMQGKDGYLYHVALNGVGEGDNRTKRMPGYGHALDSRDAWAVVAYVRALQAAANATIDDIADPALRDRLERARLLPQPEQQSPAAETPAPTPAETDAVEPGETERPDEDSGTELPPGPAGEPAPGASPAGGQQAAPQQGGQQGQQQGGQQSGQAPTQNGGAS